MFRNWNQRFFKLHADTMELEYFDVQHFDEWGPCGGAIDDAGLNLYHEARPTTMDVHREAVEDGINPIWFQKQCRFTFSCSLFDEGKVGGDDEEAVSVVDMGTLREDIRKVWIRAMDEQVVFEEQEEEEEEEEEEESQQHMNRVTPSLVHQRIGGAGGGGARA